MSASTDALHFARPRSAQFTGRWFFVGVATLFILMALAGFVPTSIAKLGAVHAGQRPPLPPVLHVHAAMMGAWLLLLLGQAVLATTGRRVWHRRLGYAGAVLLPAIIVTGVLLLIATWQMVWGPAAAAAMPPAVLAETKTFLGNILSVQIRALVTFTGFIAWALLLRRSDPEGHKRLMFLATAIPLVAGLDRFTTALGWTTLPASPLSQDICLLVAALPLLAHDLIRQGRLHRVAVAWLAINLPFAIATNLLWGSSWWLATAPRLMGVA